MENFFNYITQPVKPEDVEKWFKGNNILNEKLELFSDFSHSLNLLIVETYLGQQDSPNETKILMSDDDNSKHFEWCWDKTVNNFIKEDLNFDNRGEHFDYFKSFFDEIFYTQKDDKIRKSITNFFTDLFDINKPFTKSDLDMVSTIYKILDKHLSKKS
jgi:Zn-dependent M28 family amino/carboxypeptidase